MARRRSNRSKGLCVPWSTSSSDRPMPRTWWRSWCVRSDAGEVVDEVYRTFIEPRHKAISRLWAMATGRDAEDAEVKLAIFALVGQVLYFRIASPFVVRRMSWSQVGQGETRQIAALVIENLRSMIERQKA